MTTELLITIKKDPKMFGYLKENSEWFKYLNRNPDNYKKYIESMKVKYKLRVTDKISNAIDSIDMASNIITALK